STSSPGVSHGARNTPSTGITTRTVTLSTRNTITARTGGQSDSPIVDEMLGGAASVTCTPAPCRKSLARASSESDECGDTGVVQALRMERRLELVSTVLLAVAALATAWAAYQSRQWTGEQSGGYSRATTARLTENRSAALANRQVQIDVATFIQWLDAPAQPDDEPARLYRRPFPAH